MRLNPLPVNVFWAAFFFLALSLAEYPGPNSPALAWQAPAYKYDEVCELPTMDNYTPLGATKK